jgi:hypothetical protein
MSSKISGLEKERNDNQQALSGDFGDSKEFYYLRGSCFRSETQEYTYEVCPFDKVNQISKTGGSHTLLGYCAYCLLNILSGNGKMVTVGNQIDLP